MKNSLAARRRKLLRELDRVNQKLLETKTAVAHLQKRIARLATPTRKAA
jgi:hypothetical protein